MVGGITFGVSRVNKYFKSTGQSYELNQPVWSEENRNTFSVPENQSLWGGDRSRPQVKLNGGDFPPHSEIQSETPL